MQAAQLQASPCGLGALVLKHRRAALPGATPAGQAVRGLLQHQQEQQLLCGWHGQFESGL